MTIYREPEDIPRDSETGAPILSAQRPLAVATLTDRDTGDTVTRTLVLPNLIIHFDVFVGDVAFGEHMMCTPPYARKFIDTVLPEKGAKFGTCECEWHQQHILTVEDHPDAPGLDGR